MKPRPVECAFGFCVHFYLALSTLRYRCSPTTLYSTWRISWLVRLPPSKPTNQPMQRGGQGLRHLLPLEEPRAMTGWWWSPGPGTGNAGHGHDAATFLHHHVNVRPHDLGYLPNLKSKKWCGGESQKKKKWCGGLICVLIWLCICMTAFKFVPTIKTTRWIQKIDVLSSRW